MTDSSLQLIPEQPSAPALCTEVPGPKAVALVERDHRVTSPCYARNYPLVVDHAIGSVVVDPDGNRFLDMTAGIAVTSTGHCHPRVVAAIQEQASRCLHMSAAAFYYDLEVRLAEKLNEISPMRGDAKVFFTNSGTEANEAAMKLARAHTRRQYCIAFWGAFHGRTYGGMSLGGSKVIQRKAFSPMVPSIEHVTFPNPSCPAATTDATFAELDRLFQRCVPADEVAAIFLEPIQGEGGYIIPPDDFLPRLQALCNENGIMLVCDEVQSGMGRTGKMWAVDHWDVEPDIIVSAKGIASGMPLGAMIAKADVMDWEKGMHASTYGGNPVACAAALATIELLEEGLVENAAAMGSYFVEGLTTLGATIPIVGDVRGKGLMLVADIVQDGEPSPAARSAVVQACYRRGLLVLGCGQCGVRFSPALTVSREQADTAMEIFADACGEVSA